MAVSSCGPETSPTVADLNSPGGRAAVRALVEAAGFYSPTRRGLRGAPGEKLYRALTAVRALLDAPEEATGDGLVHEGRAPDGTDRLCLALYGRKAKPRDYLGGSNARMLHDAADRLTPPAPEEGPLFPGLDRLTEALGAVATLATETAEKLRLPELAKRSRDLKRADEKAAREACGGTEASCYAPGGACVNHGACNAADRCMYAPSATAPEEGPRGEVLSRLMICGAPQEPSVWHVYVVGIDCHDETERVVTFAHCPTLADANAVAEMLRAVARAVRP